MEELKWGLKFIEMLFPVMAKTKNKNKTEYSTDTFLQMLWLGLVSGPIANSGCIMGNLAFTGAYFLPQKAACELLLGFEKLLSPHTMPVIVLRTFWMTQAAILFLQK